MAVKNAVAKTWYLAPGADGLRWSTYPAGNKPVSGNPPTLLTDPQISAFQPRVGLAQVYTQGEWSNAAAVTASWTLDGIAFLDAKLNPSYTPVASDLGKRLGVLETATAPNGVADTATTQVKLVT